MCSSVRPSVYLVLFYYCAVSPQRPWSSAQPERLLPLLPALVLLLVPTLVRVLMFRGRTDLPHTASHPCPPHS